MSIPTEQARALIAELHAPQIENLYAQAHAKHVLHEVKEAPANFPTFDPNLDDKVTFAAYSLLAAGCSLIEQGDRSEGPRVLERAASLLQYIHGPHAAVERSCSFHSFVAAMAFYAAGHYSRAFVTIRSVEEQTPAARIVGAYLRKDMNPLFERLDEVLLSDLPFPEEQAILQELAITVAIARAVSLAVEFIFTGTQDFLRLADDQLRDAGIVATAGGYPAWWWIIRLLRLMLQDLDGASPWRILPPYFSTDVTEPLGKYIKLQAFSKRPVAELWASQRAALPLALNLANKGAVINLRTSAGKTRVAELAILQALLTNSEARIFYLAPFRSLALEVEHTLASSFTGLGYGVSHLYGGSRVSSVDTELAAESAITIATPEKARSLFRAAPELFQNVKLIIVDEGHLIGPSERFVRNEIFVDHLRSLTRATGARLLLLSAVLPNAQELAEWITGDQNSVATSTWKPSVERFGLLRWNGSRVRIDWQGEVASFNPSFIEAKPLGFSKRRNPFPNDKNEAIAASAIRLSAIGPVMIFTGKAVSVPTLAKAVLLALGENPPIHPWPEHEWKVFEAVCQEELGPEALEVITARAGVVCHSNRLTPQVRLALEHLMRTKPPRIIIATSTLAQGVNIGISSVIVATPYIDRNAIDKRDFWNICGRAGRAFVDGEGKILYAIDETREAWQIDKDKKMAQSYFNAGVGDRVESGLLFIVNALRRIASQAGVSFDILLELAANNDFSILGNSARTFEEICDLLDDELLALHTDPVVNPAIEDPITWVERLFRDSLAAIQARSGVSGTSADDVLSFLRARANSALQRVAQPVRQAVVSSGLPLSVALRAHVDLDFFRAVTDAYIEAEEAPSALLTAVKEIEEWARVHGSSVVAAMPVATKLDAVRKGWLEGVGLQVLSEIDNDVTAISKDLYGYQLPWIIHAASQQLRRVEELNRADVLARIALLVELGVPTDVAARIFLAGIRSRVAATELAALGIAFGNSVSEISRNLRDSGFSNHVRSLVSPATASWLVFIIAESASRGHEFVPVFPRFTLQGAEEIDVLHVRKLGDQIFLCTVDGTAQFPVDSTDELPFDRVANDPRVAFMRVGHTWQLTIRDPRLSLHLGD